MTRTFYSLRYFNYRLWFVGALVANIGTWMQRVAQDWLVLTHLTDDNGTALGIVTGLQFLPMLLLSPFAGLVADRFDRRRMLVLTQTALGLLAGGLGAVVLAGVAQLWHVYVFALLLGVVTAFDNPARQTFVAEMVPPEQLPNAVGLNSTSFNAARLVGPAVGGVLIAAVGTGWAFVVNAVSFGATIVALVLMREDELRPMPRTGRAKGQVREGLRYIRRRTDIVTILVVVGVVSAFGMNFQVTNAVMAREVFGTGAGEYGLLGSAMAVGTLAGALLAARRKEPRVRLVLGSAFAFGVFTTLAGLMPTYETYLLTLLPVGLTSLTMMTAANATVQMSTAPHMRGRVMSIYMMVFLGTTPIGAPVIGWVAEVLGPRWSLLMGGIPAMVVAALAAIWAAKKWDVEIEYHRRQRPHLTILGPHERALTRDRLAASDAENAAGAA